MLTMTWAVKEAILRIILHYKDLSGAEIQRALIEKAKSYANITVHENCMLSI